MVMQPGQMETGAGQPCKHCPDHQLPSSGKMTLCSILACAGPVMASQATGVLSNHPAQRVVYSAVLPARLAGATPAPDPFPPKPIVLL